MPCCEYIALALRLLSLTCFHRLYMTPIYFGNVYWTTLVQTFISLLVTIVLAALNAISIGYLGFASYTIIPVTALLIVLSVTSAWGSGFRALLMGVRELAYHGTPSSPVVASLHWRRREQDDVIGTDLESGARKAIWKSLVLAITRRTPYGLGALQVFDISLNPCTIEKSRHPSSPDVETSPP